MSEAAVAPTIETAAAPAVPALTPAGLGLELFEAAMRGEVALSDHTACWAILRHAHGHPSYDLVHGARRVAIDLVQHVARRPDAALVRACRAALTAARAPLGDVPADGELPDAHAVLDQVADLLDGALALTSTGGH